MPLPPGHAPPTLLLLLLLPPLLLLLLLPVTLDRPSEEQS